MWALVPLLPRTCSSVSLLQFQQVLEHIIFGTTIAQQVMRSTGLSVTDAD